MLLESLVNSATYVLVIGRICLNLLFCNFYEIIDTKTSFSLWFNFVLKISYLNRFILEIIYNKNILFLTNILKIDIIYLIAVLTDRIHSFNKYKSTITMIPIAIALNKFNLLNDSFDLHKFVLSLDSCWSSSGLFSSSGSKTNDLLRFCCVIIL